MRDGDTTWFFVDRVAGCLFPGGNFLWFGGSLVTVQRGQRGSGTLMGLAVLASLTLSGSSAIAVTAGLNEARRVQAVANQSALAASDVSRGVVPGHPCRVASALVSSAQYRLEACDVVHGTARIVVTSTWWGMPIEKRAHAGPAPNPVFRGEP